ncbi:MAG: PhnD/SsuA/transferrin family substrate-binding protein [Hyphomicrobiaceae bacterium]|nr:PhnD/SsuA/transferrin family substrate-binding protein [Hyphomicrobiaceae bacterium]
MDAARPRIAPARVSLPMYNLPEMRAQNAAFWHAMRVELSRCGVDEAPDELDFERKPVPSEIEADTLLTQVCGYPLQTIYRGQAVLLAAPVYADDYSDGPTHRGIFIVRKDAPFRTLEDLRGCRYAFNSIHSNSGMNLPRRAIADIAGGRPFFGSIVETHGHPANIERVARGEIDATCVDCVTYAFLERYRPAATAESRVLGATPPSPSIPFVTAAGAPPALQEALRTALLRVARAAEWASVREGLLLKDIVPIADASAYADLLDYETQARALGYPELR